MYVKSEIELQKHGGSYTYVIYSVQSLTVPPILGDRGVFSRAANEGATKVSKHRLADHVAQHETPDCYAVQIDHGIVDFSPSFLLKSIEVLYPS